MFNQIININCYSYNPRKRIYFKDVACAYFNLVKGLNGLTVEVKFDTYKKFNHMVDQRKLYCIRLLNFEADWPMIGPHQIHKPDQW